MCNQASYYIPCNEYETNITELDISLCEAHLTFYTGMARLTRAVNYGNEHTIIGSLEQLKEALEKIDWRGKLILTRRFGIDGHYGETLQEVAEQLKMSRERARQLEAKALADIRNLKLKA